MNNTIIANTTFKFTFDIDGSKKTRKFIRGIEYIDLDKNQYQQLMKMNNREKFFLTIEEYNDKNKSAYAAKGELAMYKQSLEKKENELLKWEESLKSLETKLMKQSKTKK